jgi:hypothetical protein
MRRFRTTIVLALATLLSISICSAQQTPTTSVPNLIRYSGTLKDAQGVALSSSTAVGVTFAIYKQQDGGASVWMETQNVTPDSNGQYNVILGSTTATGLTDDLFLQQEQRWLGVQVQGEAEQARVLLVSVPYAFKAHEAETLGGLPASAFVRAPTTDASGSEATGANNGTSVNALSSARNAVGTGASGKTKASFQTPGFIPVYNSGGTYNDSLMFQDPFATVVNDNGNFNLVIPSGFLPPSPSYQIGGSPVLSIVGFGRTTLSVGVGAGSDGDNSTFTGTGAGHSSSFCDIGNTFTGAYAGYNNHNGVFATISANTFTGAYAGQTSVGSHNVFSGYQAGANSNGSNNTFSGYGSGFNNNANGNSFYGYQAGYNNTAKNNSFYGFSAGMANTSGQNNTFLGNLAGTLNTTGFGDTFVGDSAGAANTTGIFNAYVGQHAGKANSTGYANAFIGSEAGSSNTHGAFNTFVGQAAGYSNVTGLENTSVGSNAGENNLGSYNIFLGGAAGDDNVSGSNDIYVGNLGDSSLSSESNTIRIGNQIDPRYPKQTDAYIAGIYHSSINPTNEVVCIDASGKLASFGGSCTIGSSLRFKEQIANMGDGSSRLFQLRPVTFFYKPRYDDGSHALQYGLIAEEVAKVYPEMVAYDKDGQPYTVKYQLLAPMLLNELQKQHKVVAAQQDELQTQLQQIKTQQQQMQAQRHEIDGLKLQLQQQDASLQERLSKLESYVATQMETASDNPPRTTPGANGGLQ